MIEKGFYWHVHHDNLLEWCYGYQERVDYINEEKPENERKIRLKRFVMLTEEQVAMLPKEFTEAWQKYGKLWQKYDELRQKYDELRQKYNEASQKRDEAWQKCGKICVKYKLQLEEIHKKICGCREWDGTELVFSE